MSRPLFAAAFLFLCFLCARGEEPHDRRTRVIGGQQTPQTYAPYLAALFLQDGNQIVHFCGGTILDRYWVMTAAHCFNGQDDNDVFYVGTGTTDLYAAAGGAQDVAGWWVHPTWDGAPGAGSMDVALIRLREPLVLSSTVAPLALPTATAVYPEDVVVVAGWGLTRDGGELEFPRQARSVSIPVQGRAWCSLSPAAALSYFCAGLSDPVVRDTCVGDSGGPAAMDGKVVGIISYDVSLSGGAEICAGYGGYQRTSVVAPWVRTTVQEVEACISNTGLVARVCDQDPVDTGAASLPPTLSSFVAFAVLFALAL